MNQKVEISLANGTKAVMTEIEVVQHLCSGLLINEKITLKRATNENRGIGTRCGIPLN
jgi:hypothetical protein